jgi:hypothetical protein
MQLLLGLLENEMMTKGHWKSASFKGFIRIDLFNTLILIFSDPLNAKWFVGLH